MPRVSPSNLSPCPSCRCVDSLHTEWNWPVKSSGYCRNDRVGLWRLAHKRHWDFSFALRWLVLRETSHNVVGKLKPLWQETKASCKQPREWTLLGEGIAFPFKPSVDCSPSWFLDWTLPGDLELKPHSQAAPKYLIHRRGHNTCSVLV